MKIKRLLEVIERKKWFFIMACIFYALLEISYFKFINPEFEYAGFTLDVDVLKYVESKVIYIFLVMAFPNRLTKPSDYLMAYLLLSFLTPLLVFYGLNNASREVLYIVLLGVTLISFFRNGDRFQLPHFRNRQGTVIIFLVLASIIVSLWMVVSGGLSFFNLNFSRVYDFREDVSKLIDKGLMSYLIVWTTKVFGPFLLAFALWKKKYLYVIIVLASHVFWFGISSHKSALFNPLLVIFLWQWFRSSQALSFIAIGMSLIVLFSLIVYQSFGDLTLGSLFIRRTFFIPSFLTFTYYEFFSEYGHVYWSNSITSGFLDYPFDREPAKLIGDSLNTDAHANNSFLATGYMHAGILGVMFYGIVVGLIFRLIDSITGDGIPSWLALATVIVPCRSLMVSADLPTAILTHGIGVGIIILVFITREARANGRLSR
ncbi:hypothetical protein N9F58_00185 [Akkermansiaceae bacterium]|nr:hypothetical protein [Akkermansiaceae bacterium]